MLFNEKKTTTSPKNTFLIVVHDRFGFKKYLIQFHRLS